MIRNIIVPKLLAYANFLGSVIEGSEWHIFGSVDRNELGAADIDLMIFCVNSDQADKFRELIDPDFFELPVHLSIFTHDEAKQVDAVRIQKLTKIYPAM